MKIFVGMLGHMEIIPFHRHLAAMLPGDVIARFYRKIELMLYLIRNRLSWTQKLRAREEKVSLKVLFLNIIMSL
jgi:hypothetical protein